MLFQKGIGMAKVAFCLTSCERFDLLSRTIDSFVKLNTYPINQYLISEDSGKREVGKQIIQKYGHFVTLVFNSPKIGQLRSIDRLYNMVDADTQYIMHMQDDWGFDGNPNFLTQAIDVLEADPNVNMIWVRHRHDFEHPYEDEVKITPNGTNYLYVQTNFQDKWHGFSFNPTIIRVSDYRKFFPNGYSEYQNELGCNNHAYELGWRTATLAQGACKHIGWDRRVTNWK